MKVLSKVVLCVIIYMLLGMSTVVVMSKHPKSMNYNETSEYFLGWAVLAWPIVLIVDGANLSIYEIGSIVKEGE